MAHQARGGDGTPQDAEGNEVNAMAVTMMLEGWKQIAHALTEHARLFVSIDQAVRYAQREDDPLPVERIGRSLRPRIVADPTQVAHWSVREFRAKRG